MHVEFGAFRNLTLSSYIQITMVNTGHHCVNSSTCRLFTSINEFQRTDKQSHSLDHCGYVPVCLLDGFLNCGFLPFGSFYARMSHKQRLADIHTSVGCRLNKHSPHLSSDVLESFLRVAPDCTIPKCPAQMSNSSNGLIGNALGPCRLPCFASTFLYEPLPVMLNKTCFHVLPDLLQSLLPGLTQSPLACTGQPFLSCGSNWTQLYSSETQ